MPLRRRVFLLEVYLTMYLLYYLFSPSTATSSTPSELEPASVKSIRELAVNRGNKVSNGAEIELHDVKSADVGKQSRSKQRIKPKTLSRKNKVSDGHGGEYINPSFQNYINVDEIRPSEV